MELEILVNDPTAHEGGNVSNFIEDLEKELFFVSDEVEIKDIDLHRGADAGVVLAILGGLFFLGKKIDENLDAWLSIGEKFTSLIRKLRKKYSVSHICEKGATLIAIERIMAVELGNILSIDKVSEQVIPIEPFEVKPDSLYLQVFKVNDLVFHVFGIKSNGQIVIEYRIDIWSFRA